jgi:protein-S-isoprenylcysteine O-methyltransferase Ste14
VRYGIGILAALLLQFGEGIPVIGHRLAFLPRSSPALNVAVIILAVSGMVVAVMARRTLAGNWSGEVVVKKDHELIQTGVYAYARHPIYTGFLLLMLGTALLVGTPVAFMILIVMALGVRSKSRKEEILMIRCFPDQYPDYQARVKAIIPFIW